MKIQKVKIKDFKVIHDLEVDLKGANVLLLGDNGVGKSSFIQFIEIALGKQTNIPVDAEGEGMVIVDKEGKEYKLSVKFKGGKPVVSIETPDGFKDSRKSILAQIVGAIDFDIDDFVSLSNSTAGRKKQVEIFKSFLDEETRNEIARYEQNVKSNYDERTELSRIIKEKEGVLSSSIYRNELDTVITEIDVKNEMQKLNEANTHNAKVSQVLTGIGQKRVDFDKNKAEIERLQKLINDLNNANSQIEIDLAKGAEWLDKNKTIDTTPFENAINEATEINAKASKIKDLKEVETLLTKMKGEYEDLTVKIEVGRQSIADAIRDMSTPVEGLSFDDDQLYYNGIAVNESNLSSSEIMELGIKLKMAENPEAPLFLQRGESLGAKRYAEILELCKKNNYQLIMEQVERGNEKLTIELIAD